MWRKPGRWKAVLAQEAPSAWTPLTVVPGPIPCWVVITQDTQLRGEDGLEVVMEVLGTEGQCISRRPVKKIHRYCTFATIVDSYPPFLVDGPATDICDLQGQFLERQIGRPDPSRLLGKMNLLEERSI